MRNEAGQSGGAAGGTALVQSVDRAITVLEILGRRGEAGVTEIAQELGVHKSTAFRLVGVLEGRGLVEQTADRGKYRLGFGIVRLAGATTAQMDLGRQSQPVCEQLAGEIGETVNVAILEGGYAVNISQVHGTAAVSVRSWVGQRTPLHATSSGKVLLAWAPPLAVDELLDGRLERFTSRTITRVPALRRQLAQIREVGYAHTVEEYELGLNAVAAAVRAGDGSVLAALSASGPSYRMPEDRIPALARLVVAGAARISERLGYAGVA